eukprot:CAMPEP_0184727326 /NCGR_PEP_ID=MMETSP0314-20130426/36211_1 /TAXON_ID=38298 /ORGANISM="Rhodella maculata, Strain CCMP 736" /LENGTH=87 /DNA_ID=CAMNT_0027192903 /DNA_START=5 /DNA_END=265 /DNA_ORIENTATION=-
MPPQHPFRPASPASPSISDRRALRLREPPASPPLAPLRSAPLAADVARYNSRMAALTRFADEMPPGRAAAGGGGGVFVGGDVGAYEG